MVEQPAPRRDFYSWQSDLPNKTNRGFIERALEQAMAALAKAGAIDLATVDRDTIGVPGSPNIATTIFGKIETATAFVADISIVNPAPRPTPNPNVLIELGYAFHALGEERVILLFNLAHGQLAHVPFDLRQHRIVSYTCESSDEKATARSALAANLESQLRSIFALKPRAEADVRVLVERGVAAQGPRVFRTVSVEVQNHSPSMVYLSGIYFALDNDQQLFPKGGINGLNSSRALEPGNSHQLVFLEEEFREWVVEHPIVAAVAKDKIGRRWTSDPKAFARLATHVRAGEE